MSADCSLPQHADLWAASQAFNLIRYFGGQHSIFVGPKTLETYYTNAKPNWVIDSSNVSPHYKPYSQRSHPVGSS